MMNKFIIPILVLLSSCGNETGEIRTTEKTKTHCYKENIQEVEEWKKSCIDTAIVNNNESLDQIKHRCKLQAIQRICPKVVMVVTEMCFNCVWTEVSSIPKYEYSERKSSNERQ